MIDWLRQSFHRIRSVFRRDQLDHELDAELAGHLELAIQENLQRGMSAEEARRQALIRFGGTEQAKEQHREARGLPALDILFQDLRYAVRGLLKSPGFTTAAVLTLALGIAVNATMFSMVSAFLLRRPPGPEPDRVAVVTSINPASGFLADANPVSAPNYLAWRGANDVFADMAAADEYRTVNLTSQSQPAAEGRPEALPSAAVSPNYFTVLGVSPQLGRIFSDGEEQSGRNHVVILSHELWERRFASDTSLIGSPIRLNRENYTVIGVMPATFRLLGFTPQLWTPLVLTPADQTAAARKDRSLYLFARLKSGVTLEQARTELVTLARRAGEGFPETEKGWGAAVRTLPDFLVYGFGIRNALAILMTTVGFVLMIACANVAGLLLARSAGRRKELAVRIALGAGRLRIVRQLLTEGLVIAFLGGSTGLLLAYWGINFVGAYLTFNEAISAVPLSLDWNVLLFTLGVSLVCAALCGLAPALKGSRTDVNTSLKDEGRAASAGRSHSRLRTVLVTGEIALALFLLIGTGLLLRGIFLIEHQNLGFRADHLLTASVTLDSARYKDPSQQTLFARDLISRLQQIPGAEAVAIASDLPATGPATVTLQIKGQPALPANQRLTALVVLVSIDYFRAAGIALLHGRPFTETDNATAPRVAVVNQEFVHRHLQDQEPLGKQIRLDVSGGTLEWREIVGVVGNVKSYSEGTNDDPEVYEPFLQRPSSSFSLMVRATSDPNSLASALRDTVGQVDAELPLARVMSMPSVIERQKSGNVFFVRILGSFAILALILAAIGIYGLVAYSVGQRTHEIGIRMALGAKSPDVLRMILWDGTKMTAIGAAAGLVLALPLPKIFDAMFYGLHLGEPRLYFIVPAAILAVAMLATYVPARRATRVDPISALRQD
jgi:putative ABC transport system permease protein